MVVGGVKNMFSFLFFLGNGGRGEEGDKEGLQLLLPELSSVFIFRSIAYYI